MRLLIVAALTSASNAFIGMGIEMYNPLCAHSCRRAFAATPLDCTGAGHAAGHGGHGSSKTTPECYGDDMPFLTTLAWCMKTRCESDNIEAWRLEKFWHDKATNDMTVQAKWSYAEALEQITEAPTTVINTTLVLNYTGLVPESKYRVQRTTLKAFEEQETLHARYGNIILILGFSIPIIFTLLTFLPGVDRLIHILQPYVILPATFGSYHTNSLPYGLGNVPSRGQTLYILVFILLNVILTAVPYSSHQPSAFSSDSKEELLAYIANRAGCIAFALAPLTILFAGRNNFLLWVTNWSHSTYLLLHRWVARVFTLQCILHSIVEVELYRHTGEYETELVKPYWIWGIIATVSATISILASVTYFRRSAYEVFLVLHILLAIFVIIGSWYHVELLFQRKWGYQLWLYAASAVWFFDRICRGVLVAYNGVKPAQIKEIGDDVIRIDIPGLRWGLAPGQHAYVYFPGIRSWNFWQCHPFSVIPLQYCNGGDEHTSISAEDNSSLSSGEKTAQVLSSDKHDIEKSAATANIATVTQTAPPRLNKSIAGVRLYLRKHQGITKSLKSLTKNQITTLIEGPYQNKSQKFNTSILHCDQIILLAGGIGITGVLSFLHAHSHTKLYWSVKQRSQPLVDDIVGSGLISSSDSSSTINIVGPRFNFFDILRDGVAQIDISGRRITGRARMGVVVCGPPSFCDDVRSAVVSVARNSSVEFEFQEETFCW